MPAFARGAGDLRYQVRFSKPDTTGDVYGNPTTGWLDMFTVAANITPSLGGETVQSARLAGRQPVVITVRQTPDTQAIRTDWKATNVTTGTEYNVRTAVDPLEGTLERGKWMEMLAEAGVAV